MADKPNLLSEDVIAVGWSSTGRWAHAAYYTDQAWTTGQDYQQVCSVFDVSDAPGNSNAGGFSSGWDGYGNYGGGGDYGDGGDNGGGGDCGGDGGGGGGD